MGNNVYTRPKSVFYTLPVGEICNISQINLLQYGIRVKHSSMRQFYRSRKPHAGMRVITRKGQRDTSREMVPVYCGVGVVRSSSPPSLSLSSSLSLPPPLPSHSALENSRHRDVGQESQYWNYWCVMYQRTERGPRGVPAATADGQDVRESFMPLPATADAEKMRPAATNGGGRRKNAPDGDERRRTSVKCARRRRATADAGRVVPTSDGGRRRRRPGWPPPDENY